jgi:hypothetical protein
MNLFGSIKNYFTDKGILLTNERSWHESFIGEIAKQMRPSAYLELGVYRGETYRKVSKWSEVSVGLDINPVAIKSISSIKNSIPILGEISALAGRSDVPQTYDLIFIDADHAKESVVSDFKATSILLKSNGLILLHDTWPKSKSYTTPGFCGDAYLAVGELRGYYPDWSFVTLPAHPGLTLCQKNSAMPL